MNAPLPSEINISVMNKLSLLDEKFNKKVATLLTSPDGDGKQVPEIYLDKPLIKGAGMGVLVLTGMVILNAMQTINIASNSNSMLTVSLIASVGLISVGALVLGTVEKYKLDTKKDKIKEEVLKEQYSVTGRKELEYFSKMDDKSFNDMFKEAVYSSSVKSAIEEISRTSLTERITSSVSSIRNNFFAKKEEKTLTTK